MSILQEILLKIPPLVSCTIILFLYVIISISGLLIVRRFISHERLKMHNDVAGFIFATLGTIYAVLLAFTVVIVWGNYESVESNIEKEANCLAGLYRDSDVFPEHLKQNVLALFNEYAEVMLNEEWELLGRGESSPRAWEVVDNIWQFYRTYTPQTITEQIFFKESVKKLNEFFELRRSRLFEARRGISYLLWYVLIFGGVITIVFTFFFGMENLRAQIVMTVLLAIIISLIVFTIFEFDFPFTGGVSISPDPFRQFIAFSSRH